MAGAPQVLRHLWLSCLSGQYVPPSPLQRMHPSKKHNLTAPPAGNLGNFFPLALGFLYQRLSCAFSSSLPVLLCRNVNAHVKPFSSRLCFPSLLSLHQSKPPSTVIKDGKHRTVNQSKQHSQTYIWKGIPDQSARSDQLAISILQMLEVPWRCPQVSIFFLSFSNEFCPV